MRAVIISALFVVLVITIVGCGQTSTAPSNTDPIKTVATDSFISADDEALKNAGLSAEESGSSSFSAPADVALKESAPVEKAAGEADFNYAEAKDAATAETSRVSRRDGRETSKTPSSGSTRESRQPESRPAVKPPQYDHQAGTLTAGSIDDHKKFDEYQQYLSRALQASAGSAARFSVGTRAVINVQNENGEPISDARIVVKPFMNSQELTATLLKTQSGSDGKSFFVSSMDAQSYGPNFMVSVTDPSTQETISQKVNWNETPWTITLPQAKSKLPTQLDLALVIDTTGSMGDELEYLKAEIDSIAVAVEDRFPKVSQRYSLVLYRDQGDQYVTRTFDFTDSLSDFRQKLSEQSANGGGNYPEAMHLALEQSTQLSWRKKNTARVMFLVADAPPHDHSMNRTLDAVQLLRKQDVAIFPVAASGVREKAEFLMRATAFLTNSQYLFLTDHSGVGNPHAKPQTSQFNVERLDQLMIRMIVSELAGRKLLPTDIIATEGDEPYQTPEPEQTSMIDPGVGYCGVGMGETSPSPIKSTWFRCLVIGLTMLGCCILDRVC